MACQRESIKDEDLNGWNLMACQRESIKDEDLNVNEIFLNSR